MDSLQKIPPVRRTPSGGFPLGMTSITSTLSPEIARNKTRPTPRKKRPRWLPIIVLFSLIVITLCGVIGFLALKGVAVGQTISLENPTKSSFVSQLRHLSSLFLSQKRPLLQGESAGRINILLLGRAGEHYPGKNLTDTVMVMSIDSTTKKIALLSLPRDLYVPITDTTLFTKINSLYQYGISQEKGAEVLRKTVEHITGLPIHYFVALDFDGFEKAVDTLGGIDVDVVRDFYDPRYPGKNYSYETFEIHQGWQKLDGATALKYVRERHNDPEGDFGRAKRQQQVIQAIKDQSFSLGTLFNIFTVNKLFDTLGESVKTDMSLEDMSSLLELTKTLDTKNITSVVIDAWKKDSLLRVSHVQVGDIAAFILVPRVGNWSEIRDQSEQIFHLDTLKERRGHIAQEAATLTLLALPENMPQARKMQNLLETEMGFGMVSLAPLPAFENQPEKSIILDRTALRKPFSLDELLKRFSLEKTVSLPDSLLTGKDTDFLIIIGDDLAETLTVEEYQEQNLPDDFSFSEPLPPQPRKKLH